MGDTIIGVQFGIANPVDIVNRSVVELKTDKTFTQRDHPVAGGVFDTRFGVIDHGKVCPTCKQTNILCPGHFGHIKLARPVYLYQFLDVIQKLINVVCMSCSNPYLPDEILEKLSEQSNGIQRFNVIREATTKFKEGDQKTSAGCIHCGSQLIKKTTKVEGSVATLQIQTYEESAEPIRIQPELVLRCFERITDKHVELLGFNPKFSRPDWMICTVLAVPPLTVRPSVVMDDNQRSEDDLTHQLITIVRKNMQLREKIDKGESAEIINKYTDLLQFDVATYVDNDIKGIPQASQRSGRPLKTLKSRLGAKSGRVRGNLMGKRVDFSARSVITPDPNIDLDELGVPEEIAMNLTFPEIVTQYNRDRLMSAIRNGPSAYPGAKNIELKHENRTIRLGYVNKDLLDLKEGDIVHRHLVDGDVVLFNRQPSLHKASMMCHRIRVLPYSTFRLNVSATRPYNADFDGDEMNMHVPQSIASATELRVIATILRQIVSPRTCGPIIQMFQDSLTGVYRISQKDVAVPEHLAMNMLARMKKPLKSFNRTGQPISGVDLISNAFPLMNFKGKITLKDGKLVNGVLNKDAFGKASKGIIHVIYNDFGPERAGEFINSVQNIVTKFNLFSGFSTGPSDLIADAATYDRVDEALKEGKNKVREILESVHAGRFLNTQGRSAGEELEMKIVQALGEINNKINTDSLKDLSPKNRMIQMSNLGAGSKGSAELNITQMIALLGQQIVDGKRIQYTMADRTLPHFTKFDDAPESRGFVEKSFIAGIRPTEFFFHAMGGREGLIDTAVKTSDTGYIQRKLVKLMEDIHVEQDSTVRDINGAIVQFSYGEDGIDAIYVENQECNLATMSMEKVYSEFASTRDDFKAVMSDSVSESPPDLVDQLISDREILVKHIFRYGNKTDIRAPVHLERIINTYSNPYSVKTDLTPEYVVEELTKLCSEPFIQHNQLFHILLRFNLAPKKSIIVHRFSKDSFDEMLREIRYKYIKALVHPGEMVGPLAAQSIGEPTTQLTLNTFHSAGSLKANATQGVPRIQELLSVSHNPKNPSNVIYLSGSTSSKENAMKSMKELQKTTLRDVTNTVRIYYDPNPLSSDTDVKEDRELLQLYEKFSVTQGNNCVSPWVMRLELDHYELASRQLIDMTVIQSKIRSNKVLKIFDCIHSDTNSDKLILRIVFGTDVVKNALSLRFIEDKLLDTILTGIDGIGRVFPRENKEDLVYSDSIGGYEVLKQWVLDTEGTNLFELFMNPNVDSTRTFSDDIYEVLDVFGIETARMTMYEELMKVFEREYVNYHHVCLLVDAMTYHGRFIAIDRFGMSKLENGVLAKSSFEQTSKILFDAAVGGEFDNMKGVSANIMFGQRPPCGTGLVDILIDETRLPEGVEEDEFNNADLERTNNFVNQEEKKDDAEGYCRIDDIEMVW